MIACYQQTADYFAYSIYTLYKNFNVLRAKSCTLYTCVTVVRRDVFPLAFPLPTRDCNLCRWTTPRLSLGILQFYLYLVCLSLSFSLEQCCVKRKIPLKCNKAWKNRMLYLTSCVYIFDGIKHRKQGREIKITSERTHEVKFARILQIPSTFDLLFSPLLFSCFWQQDRSHCWTVTIRIKSLNNSEAISDDIYMIDLLIGKIRFREYCIVTEIRKNIFLSCDSKFL